MAMNDDELEEKIIANLQSKGFVTEGEHAFSRPFIAAIAEEVVKHIQERAEVKVEGTEGSIL
jgi:hypothetical protein